MKRFLCLMLAVLTFTCDFLTCFANEGGESSQLDEIVSSNFIEENETIIFDEKFLENAGTTASDWYVIALKSNGYDAEYSKYLDALTAYVVQKYETENKLHSAKATEWHRISLAVIACGGDPENVSGINLIDDGIFNRDLDRQGLNAYIWALICLGSGDFTQPQDTQNTQSSIIDKLISSQLEDGGFTLSGTMGDVDMTSMVITALSNFYNNDNPEVVECVDKAVVFLSNAQNSNGGFSSYGIENCESASQVVIAMSAIGIDPNTDSRFVKNGNSVYENIYTYKTENGFKHILNGETNYLATQQAFLAISAYSKLGQGSIYNNLRVKNDATNQNSVLSNSDRETIIKFAENVNGSDLATLKRLSQTLENYTGDDKFVLQTSVSMSISKAEEILKSISDLENSIDELSNYSFKFLHKSELDDVMDKYESLSDVDKPLVENFDILQQTQAEINTQIRQIFITILILIIICVCIIYLWKKRKNKKAD